MSKKQRNPITLINRFRNWIVERLWDVETIVSPFKFEPDSEDEINRRSAGTMASVLNHRNYPCPECEGKCAIRNADGDWVACLHCVGTGIDIEAARAAMKL